MDAAAVVIASNRGPIGFSRAEDGTITGSRGGGGLVSAMSGMATDGNTVWVCAALSELDREVARSAPDHRIDRIGHAEGGAIAMLPIDPAVLDAAYNQIANTTLWFLHHEMVDTTPAYDQAWRASWSAYVDYNVAFADAVAARAADGARVLAQDYHLALLPAMLRGRRPDLRIAHFTHTPWASPEVFTTLPGDIARDLLVGMLGADSTGFHSIRWAREFVNCCVAVLDVEDRGTGVEYDDHVTDVRLHPLGVDPALLLARAAQPDVAARRAELVATIGDRQSVVRVDRTEPSKNIVRGLAAFRDLLVRYPEHREHVVHLALAYPSRQDIADYRRYTEQVRSVASAINDELSTPTWTPVELVIEDDYARSLATLQVGDVLLVNPVRDGMNLVAKEGVLLNGDVVLVLSTQAGAADQMADDALMIEPFDVAATADALHAALTMTSEDRHDRHRGLAHAAITLSPHDWLQQQLDALD